MKLTRVSFKLSTNYKILCSTLDLQQLLLMILNYDEGNSWLLIMHRKCNKGVKHIHQILTS